MLRQWNISLSYITLYMCFFLIPIYHYANIFSYIIYIKIFLVFSLVFIILFLSTNNFICTFIIDNIPNIAHNNKLLIKKNYFGNFIFLMCPKSLRVLLFEKYSALWNTLFKAFYLYASTGKLHLQTNNKLIFILFLKDPIFLILFKWYTNMFMLFVSNWKTNLSYIASSEEAPIVKVSFLDYFINKKNEIKTIFIEDLSGESHDVLCKLIRKKRLYELPNLKNQNTFFEEDNLAFFQQLHIDTKQPIIAYSNTAQNIFFIILHLFAFILSLLLFILTWYVINLVMRPITRKIGKLILGIFWV